MACSSETPLLPPNLAPDHTCWPVGDMQHVGAYRVPGGWQVARVGYQVEDVFAVCSSREHAEELAHDIAFALVTLRQIPPSAVRALFDFFQPAEQPVRVAA